jgi:hypothetical protein
MRHIRTEREIDAPPAAVWAVLTDLPAYPAWNPHVVAAEGDLREGARLDIRVRTGDGHPRAMRVTVERVDPERTLSWVGTVVGSGVFEARHTFELHPLAGDRTRLVNREDLTGVLVGVVVPEDASLSYGAANEALAERVAAVSAGGKSTSGSVTA